MRNKLMFLTKISLNKKIKTKWFLIANLIFAILIIGLINVDSVIKFFGGDFNEKREILVIDEMSVFDDFKNNYTAISSYIDDTDNVDVVLYDKDYDSALEEIDDDDNKLLLVISYDDENYIKAKLVSNDSVGTITDTLISTSLNSVRSGIALNRYNISQEMINDINESVVIEDIVLNDSKQEDDLVIVTIMQVITLPLFMLIIFLVQMIGAEVNEEKTTKSMEIIISNVSPKVHFVSKVLSSNLFVIIQGLLLILFLLFGIGIRYIITGGNMIGDLSGEFSSVIGSLSLSGIMDTLIYMIPIIIVMTLLTFLAYSLLAGVLASMTTNLEDFQQLQTPIVIISLAGYYLSMMASMFEGSIFIKIMSYVPFISSMLTPTLYIMGEITLIDLLGSIMFLILTIYILIKYGLRIYKVGILNYSGNGLWKKMFMAVREK